MNRLFAASGCFLVISVLVVNAAAQSGGLTCDPSALPSVQCLNSPRIDIGLGAWCSPVSPAETICVPDGDTSGLGGCACGKPKASCPPPNAGCETGSSSCSAPPPPGGASGAGTGQGSPSNPSCSSPISLTSGNTYIRQTDIKQLPGLGAGIGLGRVWNSIWPATQGAFSVGIFGANWRSTYEERIFVGSDGYIKYARADGSFWSFGVSDSGYQIAAPSTASVSLIQGTANWTVTFLNGEKRLFDINSGSLTSIIDRNGNTTQLSYDGYNRLSKVVDPSSRYLIFQYGNSANAYLVTKVTSSVGHVASYTYSSGATAAGPLLTSVTEPDGTTITFEYNAPNPVLITAVKDANGKILEAHTYDSTGRGLTGVRANGVEAVTISYQNQ